MRCEVLDFTMKSAEGAGGKGRLYVDYIIRVQFDGTKVTPTDDISGAPELVVDSVAELPQDAEPPARKLESPVVLRNHIFIARRYQQFHDLHDQLRKTFSGKLPILPPRTFIGDAMAVDVIEGRKSLLQAYLNVLTSEPEWWCFALAAFCGVVDVVGDNAVIQTKVEPVGPTIKVDPPASREAEPRDDDLPPVRRLDAAELEEQERVQDSMFEL